MKRLIKIPSPSGMELEVAEFISDYLGRVKLQKVKGFGPNVIAKKTSDDDDPTILLNAHMDTVNVWKGGLSPRIVGNRLCGLGAADMKAGLAIILNVFKNFDPENLNLIFTATVDEEGNSLGAYTLLKDKGIKGDLCLVPEPSGERVMIGARGRFVVEIVLESRGGHGARPSRTGNAIEDATKVMQELRRLRPGTHTKLGKGSHCVLKIEGGSDTLSMPSRCVVRVDRHVVPGESKTKVMNGFKALIQNVPIESSIKVRWMKRPTPFLEPYITRHTPLVTSFIEEHGIYFSVGIGYGESVGDYNLFAKKMPTIVFGPKGRFWHTEREYVDIESLKRCQRFYSHFLNMLDKTQKKK